MRLVAIRALRDALEPECRHLAMKGVAVRANLVLVARAALLNDVELKPGGVGPANGVRGMAGRTGRRARHPHVQARRVNAGVVLTEDPRVARPAGRRHLRRVYTAGGVL